MRHLPKWYVPLLSSHSCPKATWQHGPTDRPKINDLWQLQRARIWTVILQPLHKYKQLLFQQRLWFLTVAAPHRTVAGQGTPCHIQIGWTILWGSRVCRASKWLHRWLQFQSKGRQNLISETYVKTSKRIFSSYRWLWTFLPIPVVQL